MKLRAIGQPSVWRWMKQVLHFCLLASCGVASMTGAPQPPQKTSMEGSRANRSKATIEDLVRDIACPIQDLDGNATHLSMECALACVKEKLKSASGANPPSAA